MPLPLRGKEGFSQELLGRKNSLSLSTFYRVTQEEESLKNMQLNLQYVEEQLLPLMDSIKTEEDYLNMLSDKSGCLLNGMEFEVNQHILLYKAWKDGSFAQASRILEQELTYREKFYHGNDNTSMEELLEDSRDMFEDLGIDFGDMIQHLEGLKNNNPQTLEEWTAKYRKQIFPLFDEKMSKNDFNSFGEIYTKECQNMKQKLKAQLGLDVGES